MKNSYALMSILALALGASTSTLSAAEPKATYEANCQKCHGEDGKGQTKMGQKMGIKDYSLAKTWADIKDADAFKNVKEGMKDGDKTKMKPFGETLSDADIKAVVGYMKTFKK